VTTKPILCGKCGTSSDDVKPFIITAPDSTVVGVYCGYCERTVEADSLPAALAKFEEKVSDVKTSG
jgi:hypothetical protein